MGTKIERIMSPEKFKPITYTIVGEYNDKFEVIKQLKTNFPEESFDYKIYEVNNTSKKLVLNCNSEKSMILKAVYKDSQLKCYSICDFYLFKLEGQDTFQAVGKYYLQVHPEEFQFLNDRLKK